MFMWNAFPPIPQPTSRTFWPFFNFSILTNSRDVEMPPVETKSTPKIFSYRRIPFREYCCSSRNFWNSAESYDCCSDILFSCLLENKVKTK